MQTAKAIHADSQAYLWVDDFVASLVKQGQQLLMHRALLSVTAGWAHHASHTGWGIYHLAGQTLLGLLRHPRVHVQLGCTLKHHNTPVLATTPERQPCCNASSVYADMPQECRNETLALSCTVPVSKNSGTR